MLNTNRIIKIVAWEVEGEKINISVDYSHRFIYGRLKPEDKVWGGIFNFMHQWEFKSGSSKLIVTVDVDYQYRNDDLIPTVSQLWNLLEESIIPATDCLNSALQKKGYPYQRVNPPTVTFDGGIEAELESLINTLTKFLAKGVKAEDKA